MSLSEKDSQTSASSQLEDLCRQTQGFPNAAEVQRLVRNGADIFLQCPGYFMPMLHHFALHGKIDCVAACLSSPSPIDFRVTQNKQEFTVFHCLSRRNTPKDSRALLYLLFDRVKKHSEDVVDWNLEDLNSDNFFSAVARYHQLCNLWPCIKDHLQLPELVPICLNCVWEDDWEALGEEEQKYFSPSFSQVFRGNKATQELSLLCRLKGEDVTVSEVDMLIANGADIGFRGPDMDYPIFHYFISRSMIDCVISCLNTSEIIDFTVTDDWGWTPLHFVCVRRNSADIASLMMTHIIHRIERSPEDVVSFSYNSKDGYDFISCAARYEKLTALWPLVQRMPYFDDKMEPIPLKRPVWRYDWEELGETEQQRFTLEGGVIEANRSTAMLVRECEFSGWLPARKVVEDCVRGGADIFFVDLDMNKPLLFHFIINGVVDIVDICLSHAAYPLCFTTTGEFGMTALHCIACRSSLTSQRNSPHNTDTISILSLLLNRLRTHPSDMVDWSQKDDHGYDFVSYAAYYGNLSSFWPLIKSIAPFSTNTSEIPLFLPVNRIDWEKMGDEQKHFRLSSSFSTVFR